MITASRRASATIAFFIPRCLAIFIAQALSHRALKLVEDLRPIRDQSAGCDKEAFEVDRGQFVPCGKRDDQRRYRSPSQTLLARPDNR
jgi:hypothetical protein